MYAQKSKIFLWIYFTQGFVCQIKLIEIYKIVKILIIKLEHIYNLVNFIKNNLH